MDNRRKSLIAIIVTFMIVMFATNVSFIEPQTLTAWVYVSTPIVAIFFLSALYMKLDGIIQAERVEKEQRARQRIIALLVEFNTRANQAGFIYIMRREDGIYKIGRSSDVERRLGEHQESYASKFQLVKRFVAPDKVAFEKLALAMTKDYEYHEPGRTELRQMSDVEMSQFLAEFYNICMTGVDL